MINVLRENYTKVNVNTLFKKTIALYNKGEYDEALIGFEKLSKFNDNDLSFIFIPHIEKCKRIKAKPLNNPDKEHQKNQAILKGIGWIDNLKYIAGFSSLIFFSLFGRSVEEANTSLSQSFGYLFLAIFLGFIACMLEKSMYKFTVSQGLVRCKYCGQYTHYTNPDAPSIGFPETNSCSKCYRMHPMPDFYWDGWDGLEYMKNRTSVPDEEFYKEYAELKTKFSKEYDLFKKVERKYQ